MLSELYTLRWKNGKLIPANDCNPDGTSEPLLLVIGKENAERAAEHQIMYAFDEGDVPEAILLSDAIRIGLISSHAAGL